MPQCEVCGNEYDKAFQVIMPDGSQHTFDSFECASHALSPRCAHCGVQIIGHGIDAHDRFFCCAHCADQGGFPEAKDRVTS